VAAESGAYYATVADPSGAERFAWVLTYIEGRLLDDYTAYSPGLLQSLGRAVATVDRALLDFSDPRAERRLQWDIAGAPALRPLARFTAPAGRRAIADYFFRQLDERVLPLLCERPRSVIHNDGGNQHNMIVGDLDGRADQVKGIIDFGDAVRTHTICGLGIAAAYATFGCDDPVAAVAGVASGYHRVLPLEEEDLDLVLWLAAGRLVLTVSIAAQRAVEDPGNEYALVSAEPAWRTLEKLHRLDLDRAGARIRESIHEAR
jgi:Ser/Thr protein kinase RdoA (MazF antagonist)